MGVEPKIGVKPPKWMVYNGKPLLKWMIWGYHYFWKHPYTYNSPDQEYSPPRPVFFSFDLAFQQSLSRVKVFESVESNTPHHPQPPPKHHQTERLQAGAHKKLCLGSGKANSFLGGFWVPSL